MSGPPEQPFPAVGSSPAEQRTLSSLREMATMLVSSGFFLLRPTVAAKLTLPRAGAARQALTWGNANRVTLTANASVFLPRIEPKHVGVPLEIMKLSDSFALTLAPSGRGVGGAAVLINGAATTTISACGLYTAKTDGQNWYLIRSASSDGGSGDTALSNVWWVDTDKVVAGTRDGSIEAPFTGMTDALLAWKAAGCSGVIYVVSADALFVFPAPALTANGCLRIVGMAGTCQAVVGSSAARTLIGAPDAGGALDLDGFDLTLSLENVAIEGGGITVSDGALSIFAHNARVCSTDVSAVGVNMGASYFYDSDFFGNDLIVGAFAAAPRFHNCLMGDVQFAAVGGKVHIVAPTNRNTDEGSPQAFTISWPGGDASNKAYLDGVANYLFTGADLTLTNGNAVVMA